MSIDSSKPTNPKTGILQVIAFVLIGIATLYGSQVIASLILSIYPLIKGWSINKGSTWLQDSIVGQFIFYVLAGAISVAFIYYLLKKTKTKPSSIGLRKPAAFDPIYGILGLPAYIVLYFVFQNAALIVAPHLNVNQKQQIGFNNVNGLYDIVLTFFSLVVLPPIAEEIIFRGLIYTNLRKKLNMVKAGILTSLLFGAGHLLEGGSSGPLYIAAIDTFSLSLVLVYLREKTGGLYAGMTLHALKNLITFVALLALHQL